MLSGTTKTTTTAPAPAPYNLDDRVNPARAGLFTLGMVLGVVMFGVGAALGRLGLAEPVEYRDMGGWVWLISGGALATAGAALFALGLSSLWALSRYEIRARELWTQQVLAERRASGGVISIESESEWSLRADDPRDLLLVALACYWQATRRGAQSPWSVRSLRRLELSTDSGSILIGEASEDQARALADQLSRAHIIAGRREKSAGRLEVQNADELLDLIVPLLRRV